MTDSIFVNRELSWLEFNRRVLDVQLADTVKARLIRSYGRSERLPLSAAPVVRAQERLYELTGASGASAPLTGSIAAAR